MAYRYHKLCPERPQLANLARWYAALEQRNWIGVTISAASQIGIAIPNFMLALVMMYFANVWFGLSIGGLMDPEYLDKNYAGILIIWDRMFGTFTEEKQKPTYGLTYKVETYNLLKLQYGDYVQMVRDVRSTSRLRDKLGYVFGPPGWKPDAEREEPVLPRR